LTKVSLYVGNSVWGSFKKQVFQKHGNLRKLNSEVEKLLRAAIVEDAVISAFEKVGVKTKGSPSSHEIKVSRPPLRGSPSEQILKEMRRKRVAETLPLHTTSCMLSSDIGFEPVVSTEFYPCHSPSIIFMAFLKRFRVDRKLEI